MQWLLLGRLRVTHSSKGKYRGDYTEDFFPPFSLGTWKGKTMATPLRTAMHRPLIESRTSYQSCWSLGQVRCLMFGVFCPKQQCRWDYRKDSLPLKHPIIPISFCLNMTRKGYINFAHLYILRHQHLH